MMGRKVLVTGGGGFIGSHLVDALLARGDEVVVLDDFSTGRRENLAHVADRIRLIEGSLLDAEALAAALDGVTHVSHQAAIPSVPRSIDDPVSTWRANCEGTFALLEGARRRGVRRLVFASSSSIYGDRARLPQSEEDPPRPLSPYAASKAAAESAVLAYGRSFPIETVALRYFNVFGPRQDPENPYAAVIGKFISAGLSRRPPVVFGDGTQSRDFTYIENVVDANLRALKSERAPGEVMNVACGRRVTLLELIAKLRELIPDLPEPRFEPPRPGDVTHSQADVSRAKELLGYVPKVGFEEGLERTYEWFRERAKVGRI